VLEVAIAIYVTSGPSWHTVVAPDIKLVAPVDAFTVTTLVALVVPQRPVAVAVIVAIPEKAASQFITPVAAAITPAAAGDTLYVTDVLLSAVAA
jgi:hypothetical protein